MIDCADSETDVFFGATPGLREGDEPIAGYRLLEPLGKGGFGEVWKCSAPGGLFKAIKLVRGTDSPLHAGPDLAGQELRALEFIKNIRHPFVLSVERVERVDGTLVIVMELADRNLEDLGREHRLQGRPGIPRATLLDYLAEAAEALDLINFQHGLQHLDIKPHNLFVVSGHIKVADFGLVTQLTQAKNEGDEEDQGFPGVTPRYASPETLQRQISRQSDQYSLAIVYQEMLTGEVPFKGRTASQLLLQHLRAQPDLNSLPAYDRPVIARALAKNPDERFRSCSDLVRALLLAESGQVDGAGRPRGASGLILRNLSAETPSAQPANTPAPASPPPPRYTFSLQGLEYQKPLGRTPLGELWQVTTPTGEEKIAYHLAGFAVEDPQEQAKILKYLQSLKHSALMRFETADLGPNRIVLLLDGGAPTLADCRKTKDLSPGELIGYLLDVAEVLDTLLTTTNRCHLGLNPNNIVLGLDGVEIRDFGLVPLLWQPGNEPLTMCNPRYAAPELAANKPSTSSDQYSLAMIYLDMVQEHGSGSNKSSTPVRGAGPVIDFSKFSDQERSILQQALDKDPRKRFAGNCQFVEALAEALQRRGIASTTTRNVILAAQAGFLDHLREWVGAQLADSGDRHTPPPDGSLTTAFIAQLVPGTTPLRLEVFRQEWNADFKSRDGDCSRFFVPLPRTFWQRLRSKVIGVDVDVVTESAARQNGVTRIRAALRPVGCDAKVAQEIHERMGPAILASLRTSFGASLERRSTDRLPFARPIMVRHRRTGQRPVELACEGKDISTHGICFVSPKPLERCAVRVQFSLSDDPKDAPILLRAKVIRCEALNNGSFEVGAQFIQEESK